MTKHTQKHNKKNRTLWLPVLFLPVALLSILIALLTIDTYLTQQIQKIEVLKSPLTFYKAASYPVFTSVLGAQNTNLQNSSLLQDLTAAAIVVMDKESKVVLLSKNAHFRFSMASTTKIMTALTALDYYSKDSILPVWEDTVLGAIVGFKKGEKILFEDALYALLLPSGNDAAVVIAQNYPGGEVEFVKKMNEKAKEYHLTNTHFGDPTGLNDYEDYTTANDLARLASIAMENTFFSKVVSTKQKIISTVDNDNTRVYTLHNLNKLLGAFGVNGIKTGFTDEAGEVLVTSRFEQGHTLIIVVMKSLDRFSDTQKLLSILHGSVSYISFDRKVADAGQNALVNTAGN